MKLGDLRHMFKRCRHPGCGAVVPCSGTDAWKTMCTDHTSEETERPPTTVDPQPLGDLLPP